MNAKIKLYDPNDVEIPLELKVFPGGEVKVRILAEKNDQSGFFTIRAHLFNSVDVMMLIMLNDACSRHGMWNLRLVMPYVPYARQDRVCNDGESFSSYAFAKLINELEFASVEVYDIHSATALCSIDNAINIPSHELIRKHTDVYDWICRSVWSGVPTYLICPDKGAIVRTNDVASHFSFRGMICADKVRRPEDGVITGIKLVNPDDGAKIKGARLLIVDDICDGGRTFIELAKVLNEYEPSQLNLYVTHGIFSQGKEVLQKPVSQEDEYLRKHLDQRANTGPFDNVWCTVDFTEYK